MNDIRFFNTCIKNVAIEISSKCNRTCGYCPVSVVHRERALLPIETFKKTIKDLKDINYCNTVSFHQFNEPLLEYSHLKECLIVAKNELPHAKKMLYTNGDLLDYDIFLELVDLDVTSFVITEHMVSTDDWNYEICSKKIEDMKKRIGLERRMPMLCLKKKDYIFFSEANFEINSKNISVHIQAPNYFKFGRDRMENVNVNKLPERTIGFCSSIIQEFNITYTGNSYLCCECSCEGLNGIEKYRLGSILEYSITELFAMKKNYMKEYFFGELPDCCKKCNWR